MEIVVNTAKRKKPKSACDDEAKKPFVAKSALDMQKLQLEKLMKDPVYTLFNNLLLYTAHTLNVCLLRGQLFIYILYKNIARKLVRGQDKFPVW